MNSIAFNVASYRKIVDLVSGLNSSNYTDGNQMNVHQVINFLIYHIQVALGEITVKSKPGLWDRTIRKHIDLYWHYAGRYNGPLEKKSMEKEFTQSGFAVDKCILLAKFKKFVIQPDGEGQNKHPIYGYLSKEEYVLLILRMINFYLKPFANNQPRLKALRH